MTIYIHIYIYTYYYKYIYIHFKQLGKQILPSPIIILCIYIYISVVTDLKPFWVNFLRQTINQYGGSSTAHFLADPGALSTPLHAANPGDAKH